LARIVLSAVLTTVGFSPIFMICARFAIRVQLRCDVLPAVAFVGRRHAKSDYACTG
jgi:hypothetical protein